MQYWFPDYWIRNVVSSCALVGSWERCFSHVDSLDVTCLVFRFFQRDFFLLNWNIARFLFHLVLMNWLFLIEAGRLEDPVHLWVLLGLLQDLPANLSTLEVVFSDDVESCNVRFRDPGEWCEASFCRNKSLEQDSTVALPIAFSFTTDAETSDKWRDQSASFCFDE